MKRFFHNLPTTKKCSFVLLSQFIVFGEISLEKYNRYYRETEKKYTTTQNSQFDIDLGQYFNNISVSIQTAAN